MTALGAVGPAVPIVEDAFGTRPICPLCNSMVGAFEERGDYKGRVAHRVCAMEREIADLREDVEELRGQIKAMFLMVPA